MKNTLLALYAMVVALGYVFVGNCQDAAPAERHIIQATDKSSADRIAETGARLIANYGGYKLFEGTSPASAFVAGKAELRDQYNFVLLNAARIDTSKPETQSMRKKVGPFFGKRLHIVHFVGPIQTAWRRELLDAGVEIVGYIPQNAYLVRGDSSEIARVQALAAAMPHIRWDGTYLDEYKIQPAPRAANIGDHFAIQLVRDAKANGETLKLIETLRVGPVERLHSVLNYVDIISHFPTASLAQIAARPDVISIQRYGTPKKVCERQDQIVAGNLSGNIPSGPGYLPWLQSKGFTQAQFDTSGILIDLADSGIDNGTTVPDHFGLYAGGAFNEESHVTYVRLEGTASPSSSLKGCDGHGTLNAHIVCGYDHGAGFPFADAAGYHYGLGVCPFARVGSSVIFDPYDFTFPIYSDLTSRAYASGARISNNSWTDGDTDGAYNLDAQEFDALVRDAQPDRSASPASGNQELTIVFAAGNDGNAPRTISPPGTAKNVITVGGAENVQKFGGANDGADLGGNTDSQAGNANAMLQFSGRGPCDDGRQKPDLVAPAIHVSGGVIQAAKRGPDGTADSCFTEQSRDIVGIDGGPNGKYFFPVNQQFYTASSGTSHSTPCVSGGCALVQQYFMNNGWTPPSPAMSKAYLMNSARYLNGSGANDSLWSPSQGMGEMNLGTAFDGALRILRDEVSTDIFTESGQTRVFSGVVVDPTKPFRVTLAWTDAPGSTTGAAYNNDLDLVVAVAGNTYKGNVFSGAFSATGGAADPANNVESVFLPPGASGTFTVTVNATSINSVGVPNAAGDLNQDFALVIYNAGPVLAIPSPPIASPQNGLSTNSALVKVSGTGLQGATVTIYDGVKSLGSTLANSAGFFSLTVTLSDGAHSLMAIQTFNGNVSQASAAVTVVAKLVPSFVVQPKDQVGFPGGTVSFTASAYGAAPMRYFWEKNGIKIAAAANQNLSLHNLVAASAAKYQITATNPFGSITSDAANLTLEANPFSGLTGSYYGLFSEASPVFQSSGFLKLTLGTLGNFSARVLSGGESHSFSGVFPITGSVVETVSRGLNQPPLIVALNLDLSNGTEQIIGTLSCSAWNSSATIETDRAIYDGVNPFPDSSRFTLLFAGDDTDMDELGGDGFGTFAINPSGLVTFNGVLSDSTSVVPSAATVSKFGRWPFYAGLYGNLGSIWGWINFTNGAIDGSARWFRIASPGVTFKNGFTNSLSITGSPFSPGTTRIPVLHSTNLVVTLNGGDWGEALTNNATLYNGGRLVADGLGISNLTLLVNPATGVISGTFTDTATAPHHPSAIKGVVLQQSTNAAGFFTTTNGSGTFTLTPQTP